MEWLDTAITLRHLLYVWLGSIMLLVGVLGYAWGKAFTYRLPDDGLQ